LHEKTAIFIYDEFKTFFLERKALLTEEKNKLGE
jgi:hypothetical protein